MIRETIRSMDMVAIGRVVLTNREHIIALEPLDKGLMGTLLRYPYEVRDEKEYFDEIQDVKVTKDMLDLAKHIVTQKAADFEPAKFEDHYEAALAELINAKRNGKTIGAKPRPKGENVVDLMDALKKSLAGEAAAPSGKKPRKASAGQKEMLMAIEGKKPAARRRPSPSGAQAVARRDRPSNAARCCWCERLRNQRGCPRPELNQYSLSPFAPVAPDQRDVGRSRISRDVSENLSVRTWVRRHSPGPFFNREHDRGTERQASSGQRGSNLLHRERKGGRDEQRRLRG